MKKTVQIITIPLDKQGTDVNDLILSLVYKPNGYELATIAVKNNAVTSMPIVWKEEFL